MKNRYLLYRETMLNDKQEPMSFFDYKKAKKNNAKMTKGSYLLRLK